MSAADGIAGVLSDLRHGRVVPTVRNGALVDACLAMTHGGPIVDITGIFRGHVLDRQRSIFIYEDHPSILPPWVMAQFAWENTYGNVYVASLAAVTGADLDARSRWEPAEPFEWRDCAYALRWVLWSGGKTAHTKPTRTTGPLYMWDIAVHADGHPLDIHWTDLLALDHKDASNRMREEGLWDNALLTLLQSLNFLNCRNVEIVEPRRPRHERRRLERAGVRIHTINVFPVGRTSRSAPGDSDGQGVPLTSVRGHFAHYGPAYDRGLLFGKLAGRFWVSQHARGTAEEGVSIADYQLVPRAPVQPSDGEAT